MAKSKSEGGNKAQFVRDALKALGADAKPVAIQQWIKDNFGQDMETGMISSYKSLEAKKKGEKGPRGGGGKGGDIISDIATIRSLISKHGKSSLVKLIDALGE